MKYNAAVRNIIEVTESDFPKGKNELSLTIEVCGIITNTDPAGTAHANFQANFAGPEHTMEDIGISAGHDYQLNTLDVVFNNVTTENAAVVITFVLKNDEPTKFRFSGPDNVAVMPEVGSAFSEYIEVLTEQCTEQQQVIRFEQPPTNQVNPDCNFSFQVMSDDDKTYTIDPAGGSRRKP